MACGNVETAQHGTCVHPNGLYVFGVRYVPYSLYLVYVLSQKYCVYLVICTVHLYVFGVVCAGNVLVAAEEDTVDECMN
jgi:hypothetical protein